MAIRMYTLPELVSMCKKSGLEFVSVFGDYSGEELTLDSKRCILITKNQPDESRGVFRDASFILHKDNFLLK